jgi:hypothetical protein
LKKLILVVTLILLLGVCIRINISRADGTTMSITPAQITVTPGQSFMINVTVNSVSNLSAWQVALKYNGTIVNCTAVWVPSNDVFAGQIVIPVTPTLNAPTVDGYNYTVYGNSLLSGYVNVSQGILCSLNFTCEEYGVAPLNISTAENPIWVGNPNYPPTSWISWYSYFLDPDSNEMPFTAIDGLVTNGQPTLTIISVPNGGTNPASGNYAETNGTNVSVTAIPDIGYTLDYWLLDGGNAGSANPISVLMTTSHTLEPVFSQANFTLTVIAATGGNTSLPPGTYTYAAGQMVNVSAAADNGYTFSHWILDGSQVGSTNPFPVSMNSNHTLTPVFSSTSFPYIYIRSKGNIDPPGAPISSSDNVTYRLAADLNSTITVQRNNIVIDGNGHTLQGSGSADGLRILGVNNVSITDINITGFSNGIDFWGTSQDVVSESNITANENLGIDFYDASNSTICRNSITSNNGGAVRLEYLSDYNGIFENDIGDNGQVAIYIDSSLGNVLYHNNFVNNTSQAQVASSGNSPINSWDDGYPSGGNYWSDYNGMDIHSGPYQNVTGSDGIGDTAYVIDANNTDHFPLMGMFSSFSAVQGYSVNIVSNSTITDFHYSNSTRKISFNVQGENGTTGFCQLMIPHALMDVNRIEVLIDNGSNSIPYSNFYDNTTHRWIYFSYQDSTHTVTVQEDWTPPTIIVLSPENITYFVNHVSLNYTVSKPTSWMGYSLDGLGNVTIAGNTTLTNLSVGSHAITVYANDTVGNMGRSTTVLFAVNTTPPTIVVLSPENQAYSVNHVLLNFTVNEQTSWMGYSLDGSANLTTTGNQTLINIPDGFHSIIIYGNDTSGNMGFSKTVYFTVDTTPPSITQILQNPENEVLPNENVTISAIVIDNTSGLKSVNLNYTYTNGSEIVTTVLSMTNVQGNMWNAIIPSFPYGTNVTYTIIAEDNAGNTISVQGIGQNYQVVPEYSALYILPLLMISSLLIILFKKRRNRN